MTLQGDLRDFVLRRFLSTQPSSSYKSLEGLIEGLPVGSLYLTLWRRSSIGSLPQGALSRQPDTGVHLLWRPYLRVRLSLVHMS